MFGLAYIKLPFDGIPHDWYKDWLEVGVPHGHVLEGIDVVKELDVHRRPGIHVHNFGNQSSLYNGEKKEVPKGKFLSCFNYVHYWHL